MSKFKIISVIVNVLFYISLVFGAFYFIKQKEYILAMMFMVMLIGDGLVTKLNEILLELKKINNKRNC